MPILPPEIIEVIRPFAQVFSGHIWDRVQVLVARAILVSGKRTVTCEIDRYGGKRRIIETATGTALRCRAVPRRDGGPTATNDAVDLEV